jgi:segregation and condensation protein B
LYGTTPEFLQYFGLKDLSALPTLREFQELEAGEEVMEEVSVNEADITSMTDEVPPEETAIAEEAGEVTTDAAGENRTE